LFSAEAGAPAPGASVWWSAQYDEPVEFNRLVGGVTIDAGNDNLNAQDGIAGVTVDGGVGNDVCTTDVGDIRIATQDSIPFIRMAAFDVANRLMTLLTAFQRFDYDFVLTIVLAIIGIVMVGEIVSGWMRRMFQ